MVLHTHLRTFIIFSPHLPSMILNYFQVICQSTNVCEICVKLSLKLINWCEIFKKRLIFPNHYGFCTILSLIEMCFDSIRIKKIFILHFYVFLNCLHCFFRTIEMRLRHNITEGGISEKNFKVVEGLRDPMTFFLLILLIWKSLFVKQPKKDSIEISSKQNKKEMIILILY